VRHTRQVRLREIGAAGQARLAAAEIHVPGGDLAAEIEARYLAGAGIPIVVEDEAIAAAAREVDPTLRVDHRPSAAPRPGRSPVPFEPRDPAARQLARGAHAALVAIRTILARGAA
jgi:hypothetical protein